MTQNRKGSKDFWLKCLKQLTFLYGPRNFALVFLMHDYVIRANFTTMPRLKEKFLAFALVVLGYSIQLYFLGNFFMQNFATLQWAISEFPRASVSKRE